MIEQYKKVQDHRKKGYGNLNGRYKARTVAAVLFIEAQNSKQSQLHYKAVNAG